MIYSKAIVAWREHAPWAFQAQVEQDLVLSRALILLFQNATIQESLAFRGGTALNKLFCDSASRYSEDIDLVQIKDAPIGDVMSAIRSTIDPWLGQARWRQTSRTVRLIYHFDSEDVPSVPLRLKIEINTVEPFSVYGFKERHLKVDNLWFSGEANITTYTLEELMATKLRALYQRSKGRDLYDLWLAITKLGVDCKKLLNAFQYYNDYHHIKISRAEFEKNLYLKLASTDFLNDAKLVVPDTKIWSPESAYRLVSENLVQHLAGETWKDLEACQ